MTQQWTASSQTSSSPSPFLARQNPDHLWEKSPCEPFALLILLNGFRESSVRAWGAILAVAYGCNGTGNGTGDGNGSRFGGGPRPIPAVLDQKAAFPTRTVLQRDMLNRHALLPPPVVLWVFDNVLPVMNEYLLDVFSTFCDAVIDSESNLPSGRCNCQYISQYVETLGRYTQNTLQNAQ